MFLIQGLSTVAGVSGCTILISEIAFLEGIDPMSLVILAITSIVSGGASIILIMTLPKASKVESSAYVGEDTDDIETEEMADPYAYWDAYGSGTTYPEDREAIIGRIGNNGIVVRFGK